MLKRAIYWFATFLILFGLWLLYVDQLKWSESIAGLGAAALGAIALDIVRRCEHARFSPPLRWISYARYVPGQILRDSWLVTRKLGDMVFAGDYRTGGVRAIPFRDGSEDPRAVARRALAILYTTLSPNTVVVDFDRRGRLILHTLQGRSVPPVLRILEGER